ncbi:tRNA synthetases class I-domain-containing protein [Fomitopsis serialis]|uniref:tRNA synthetases class I-domain-containing protein n=1 Tax=Fomitopsis serialis TaxID=139415 RepID=UPI002008C3DB|nr:tRNA synthetases class I-domain-containing protein [Neoantrodia serialis]KAH9916527.1 tRNA synthetases class I-domain-containing protein [Neoantrodia serialis]
MSDSAPAKAAAIAADAPDLASISKNAEKKKAKRAEKEARLAAKVATAGPASGDKKAKPAKEKKKDEEVPFVNTTPKGEKKDVSQPMGSGYNPIAVEAAWYDWWEAQDFFKPQLTPDGKVKPEGSFVIPLPPPNVTGSLHIGHALTVAIQDTLIRWQRMLGKTVVYSVVEKRLYKTSGKTRHDLGREKFLGLYQARITNQLRRLGGSLDWDRVAFTMDEPRYKAVMENFCSLHDAGLLYRANRLVNWCVRLNTTLSNLENLLGRLAECPGYDAKEKFEFGVITSFAYPIEGSDERIIVATTRPETMLGDTAIAVHPDDSRYKHLHGKFAVHPFNNRRIPIVTDDIAVDMEFGTGAVKITPAHDFNDYEVGVRHNLEFINILNDDGTFNANAGERFTGMKRFHARVAVVKALQDADSICSKSGDVIEPILKPQWWVNCKPLAEEAIRRTRAGEMWYRWLEGIQDWCISRQLWWGHRCPAYFVRIEGQEQDRWQYWVVGRTVDEATERAKKQDEDVLDTWFSSGLWPFSIMGWPDKVLETGWDILFFWVARMVMLGITTPVFCHAMIRDAHGRKMSKSLGNVIDPIDTGQKKDFPKGIPQCGTDALRFALCAYSSGGRDINLSIMRVEGYRKFCNKVFNATKFAMLKLDEEFVPEPVARPTGNESLVERWILDKLNFAADKLNRDLERRDFFEATIAVHNFWLYELCDVYIEAMKAMTDESAPSVTKKSSQQTLYTCLDYGLRMLHPFMPFVTEELWQRLPRRLNDPTPSIMVSSFPISDKAFAFPGAEKEFELVYDVVRSGRSLAASYNLQKDAQLFVRVESDKEAALIEGQVPTLLALMKNFKTAKIVRTIEEIPAGCGSDVISPTTVAYILVRGQVDLDNEINKSEKKLDLARINLDKTRKAESHPDYEQTVPADVRAANEEKRKLLETEVANLESSIAMFEKLK